VSYLELELSSEEAFQKFLDGEAVDVLVRDSFPSPSEA
jgi:hypothetical protein